MIEFESGRIANGRSRDGRNIDGQNLVIAILLALSVGCTSLGKQWKKVIGEDTHANDEHAKPAASKQLSYNQQNNLVPSQYRKYHRTTRGDLENQAHLEGKAGSLWVMEGQGAYLFSQNIVRMIGDPIAVKLDGDPVEQLSAKSKIISKLLAQLEERRRRALGRGPAGDEAKATDPNAPAAPATDEKGKPQAGADKKNQPGQNNQQGNNGNQQQAANEETKDFGVKLVPTRVVERLVDGNYRVRGMQPFMIGQREYKVIVSGIVRAEDFNEEGIVASQLIDSNFDIVSSKGAEMRQ